MANIGSKGILRHIDDPSVSVISDTAAAGITWISDTPTAAADFIKAVAVGKGLHYKGVMSGANTELLEFASNNEIFAGQEGHAMVELLVQFTNIVVPAFTFGFNDVVEEGSLPIALSGTGLTKASSDFVGFVYNGTNATNKVMHCVWVDDDSIAQADSQSRVGGELIKMPSMAPTADKWFYMRVEMTDRGSGNGVRATFLAVDHQGRSEERTFNTSVDRDATFAWHFAIETRAATVMTIYLRNCNWEQTIPNM